MWHALLRDSKFFDLLYTLDQDLADQTRSQGCPCGGRLDQAHYPRKPRGGPANLSPDRERRFSFCCARDGCRSRATSRPGASASSNTIGTERAVC